MNATSHRQPTAAIVNKLMALVQAITWTPGGTGTQAVAAFDRVALFDSEDLVEAFRYVLITEQRVCVIVPMPEQFESVFQVRKLTVKRALPVMLLVSDRVLGNRTQALWGDVQPDGTATTPGAMGLAEMVLPAVAGLILAAPAAVIGEPKSLTVLRVKDTEKDLPARVCAGLELECRGGYVEATDLPAGGVL